jgi:hypothetical protein
MELACEFSSLFVINEHARFIDFVFISLLLITAKVYNYFYFYKMGFGIYFFS